MAATIDFGLWASAVNIGSDCTSSSNLYSDTNGFAAGDDILHNTFNGILRDVSLVTASLIRALVNTAGSAGDSMTFNNAQTLADTTTNIETLLYSRNVKTADSAPKWTTARTFTISDTHSHSGTSSSVNGTANIVLTLPDEIELSKLTATNIYVDTLNAVSGVIKTANNIVPDTTEVRQLGTNAKKFASVYSNVFNGSLNGNASSATDVNCTRVTSSSSAYQYLISAGSNTSGVKSENVLSGLRYKPDTEMLDTNISGNANTASLANAVSINRWETLVSVKYPAASVTVSTFDYSVPAIYFVNYVHTNTIYQWSLVLKSDGTHDYTEGIYNVTGAHSTSLLRLKFTTTSITMQYSNDNGSTWADCTNELIMNVVRFVCG